MNMVFEEIWSREWIPFLPPFYGLINKIVLVNIIISKTTLQSKKMYLLLNNIQKIKS